MAAILSRPQYVNDRQTVNENLHSTVYGDYTTLTNTLCSSTQKVSVHDDVYHESCIINLGLSTISDRPGINKFSLKSVIFMIIKTDLSTRNPLFDFW